MPMLTFVLTGGRQVYYRAIPEEAAMAVVGVAGINGEVEEVKAIVKETQNRMLQQLRCYLELWD